MLKVNSETYHQKQESANENSKKRVELLDSNTGFYFNHSVIISFALTLMKLCHDNQSEHKELHVHQRSRC